MHYKLNSLWLKEKERMWRDVQFNFFNCPTEWVCFLLLISNIQSLSDDMGKTTYPIKKYGVGYFWTVQNKNNLFKTWLQQCLFHAVHIAQNYLLATRQFFIFFPQCHWTSTVVIHPFGLSLSTNIYSHGINRFLFCLVRSWTFPSFCHFVVFW